jgi:hypothetical protein
MKPFLFLVLICRAFISNAQTGPSTAGGQLVTIPAFEEALCPMNLLKGDREFDGNGL